MKRIAFYKSSTEQFFPSVGCVDCIRYNTSYIKIIYNDVIEASVIVMDEYKEGNKHLSYTFELSKTIINECAIDDF